MYIRFKPRDYNSSLVCEKAPKSMETFLLKMFIGRFLFKYAC